MPRTQYAYYNIIIYYTTRTHTSHTHIPMIYTTSYTSTPTYCYIQYNVYTLITSTTVYNINNALPSAAGGLLAQQRSSVRMCITIIIIYYIAPVEFFFSHYTHKWLLYSSELRGCCGHIRLIRGGRSSIFILLWLYRISPTRYHNRILIHIFIVMRTKTKRNFKLFICGGHRRGCCKSWIIL
jgi:hypothetical protein